ncbi:RDD family protein [Streptomyces sp. HUCO-GS316]|uniref:RDD family protein n=1 Tax=Streptomyces sp. HUCO-GS316 TaxID=2692198 RepID=UPI0013681342|nr:RDD family protein [Streptomyces sp. HUCO-GS316]MXM63299.1 RDD family protein [Streptomyces sp. HUCO-GS316]
MSSEPPPGSGQQPPEDDRFRKPPSGAPGEGSGSPYDAPQGGQPPPYQGGPHGGGGAPHGGAPGDPLAGMPPLADSGRRTLARIIDMILVGIVVWLLTWGFNVREYEVDSDKIEVSKSFAQSVIAAVLYIAYDTVMIARSGQTLGKKWLRMRVADLDNGATPSVQSTLIRSSVLWIPFAFCCACIWTAIAGGWSYFDKPYKQGLHDKAAKTVVVSVG